SWTVLVGKQELDLRFSWPDLHPSKCQQYPAGCCEVTMWVARVITPAITIPGDPDKPLRHLRSVERFLSLKAHRHLSLRPRAVGIVIRSVGGGNVVLQPIRQVAYHL